MNKVFSLLDLTVYCSKAKLAELNDFSRLELFYRLYVTRLHSSNLTYLKYLNTIIIDLYQLAVFCFVIENL